MQIVRHEPKEIDIVLHFIRLKAPQVPVVWCQSEAYTVAAAEYRMYIFHKRYQVI
jgi:hypothetical protein